MSKKRIIDPRSEDQKTIDELIITAAAIAIILEELTDRLIIAEVRIKNLEKKVGKKK